MILYFFACFPFIINVFRGSDTQPGFVVTLIFAFFINIFSKRKRINLRRNGHLVLWVCGGLIAWLLFAITISNEDPSLLRIISFLFFIVSLLGGYFCFEQVARKHVFFVLLIYSLFTLVFFWSGGAIERLLIGSRGEVITTYLASGRGASTLSPEPSFFAFQIFSIFLFYRMRFEDNVNGKTFRALSYVTILLLLSSLSGYGLLYILAIFIILPMKDKLFLTFLGLGFAIFLASRIDFSFVRIFYIATKIYESIFFQYNFFDDSISRRLDSAYNYLQIFSNNWIFGDSFKYYGGGGFISIMASLGLLGFVFLFFVFFAPIFSKIKPVTKFIFTIWFMLQFISGPIGIPFYGIILGYALKLTLEYPNKGRSKIRKILPEPCLEYS